MQNFKTNILILFFIFLSALIGSGFLLKIKKYEVNYLQNFQTFQKLNLSNQSYQYLKNMIDKNIFYFKKDNDEYQAKIIRKITNEKSVELFFKIKNIEINPTFTEIRYYLKQNYY